MQNTRERLTSQLGIFEYIILRLFRRYVFKGKIGKSLLPFVPYYKKNQNLISPDRIVNFYVKYAQKAKKDLNNLNILEIGIGETNSTGYELIARFGGRFFAFDPFTKFDENADIRSLNRILKKYHISKRYIQNNVVRINSLKALKKRSIDVILSNSVLEHISNFDKFVKDMIKVLKSNGCMIHIVDYRDHFFKYPYHFLIFSKSTWDKYLNPGDLPRYRIKDHIRSFVKSGFNVKILEEKKEWSKFKNLKYKIHPMFNKFKEEEISISQAVFLVE